MKRRRLLAGSAAPGAGPLSGCASPTLADHEAEKPLLDLCPHFNGAVDVWGVFADRSGKVVKRLSVRMNCRRSGREVGVRLDDWMYLMHDQVMLNRATMGKWGVRLGEVTLSFSGRPGGVPPWP